MSNNDIKFYKNKQRGFTLLELLIVIGILAILATIAVVLIDPTKQLGKARDAKRRMDLKTIEKALSLYQLDNGSYPSTGGLLFSEGNCTYSGWTNKPDYSGNNAYIPDLAPKYISKLPGDPNVNGIYGRCYIYSSNNGGDYNISAHQGVEGSYSPNDPMIRLIAPGCTQVQSTFTISSYGVCW